MTTKIKEQLSSNGTTYPVSVKEMRERYLELFSGAINDVLRFNYKLHATSLPASYQPLREEMKMVGQAFTIKGGPDITTDGEFYMRAEMLEALHEDSVVIWDCTGDTVTSQWGEVMTMAAKNAGCRGALINGIRDTKSILEQQFPVFYQYKSNTGMLGRFRMYYYQKPVLIGEIIVNPGDWIFGDIDGVIAIPSAIAYDVLLAAEAIKLKELDIKAMIESGLKPTEVVKKGGYF